MKMAGGKLPFCWIVAYGRYARFVHKGRIFGLLKMRRDTSVVSVRAIDTFKVDERA
jgi:hypothetical protein